MVRYKYADARPPAWHLRTAPLEERNNVKDLIRKWNSIDLIKRIAVGLVIGALLGVLAPKDVYVVELLGTLFVNALKGVAPILVFFLVISALANAKAVGNMKTILVLKFVDRKSVV